VAAHFGERGTGEGVVWKPADRACSRLWFKVKGAEHAVTRVAAPRDIAPIDVDRARSLEAFAAACVTDARCEQAMMGESPTMGGLPAFVRWVARDVLREEADTIAARGWKVSDVTKAINSGAVRWFRSRCESGRR
jgi:hypothetical protein